MLVHKLLSSIVGMKKLVIIIRHNYLLKRLPDVLQIFPKALRDLYAVEVK